MCLTSPFPPSYFPRPPAPLVPPCPVVLMNFDLRTQADLPCSQVPCLSLLHPLNQGCLCLSDLLFLEEQFK